MHQAPKLWNKYRTSSQDQAPYQAFKRLFDEQELLDIATDIEFLKTQIAKLKNVGPQPVSVCTWLFYRMVCAAGALFAICSGFDGMISVLSMLFSQLFVGLIVFFAIISALSGLGVFIARDKPSIAEKLGIDESSDASGVETYLCLLQQWLHLRKEQAVTNGNRDELLGMKQEFEVLKKIFSAAKDANQKNMQSCFVVGASELVLLIGAVLFFSDGFFVGQAIGGFLAMVLHLNPVFCCFAMAILLATCALAAYCFVERPTLSSYLYGSIFTNHNKLDKQNLENEVDIKQLHFLSR